jgi:hypothetical protein
MNTMNMPGFTGEASLFRTRERYDISGSPLLAAGVEGMVIPAGELREICGLCFNGRRFCREIEEVRDCDLVNGRYECRYRLVTVFKGYRPCGE